MRRLVALILALAAPLELTGQRGEEVSGPPSSYSAAFITWTGIPEASPPQLNVFPARGPVFSITLPVRSGGFTYSADGRALYDVGRLAEASDQVQLFRIDLHSMQVTALADVSGLGLFASVAVSASGDRVLMSAIYRQGSIRDCGLFELRLPGGKFHKILSSGKCDERGSAGYRAAWRSMSFSPDGRRAVAARNYVLYLIELDNASVTSLATGFYQAAWSPDGNWIAAIESTGGYRTVLMDTKEFKVRRALGSTEGKWSPDSRYLLAVNGPSGCQVDHGTAEAVDIVTGKRWPFKSSKCKIYQTTTGWVSNDIIPVTTQGEIR